MNKESYIKLPNISISKLQDVVDFLDDNKIEYIEYYEFEKEFEKELEQENKQLKDNWNKLKEELNDLRARAFIKYNSNEWNNCLSFNDDILPIINKMQELEKGDSNEN